MSREDTTANLAERLGSIRARIEDIPGSDDFVDDYKSVRKVHETLKDGLGFVFLKALLRMESIAVGDAVDAAIEAHRCDRSDRWSTSKPCARSEGPGRHNQPRRWRPSRSRCCAKG